LGKQNCRPPSAVCCGWRQRIEREFDEEVRFHLAKKMKDNLKAGMRP
jgi:hypothetical protein